MDNEQLIIVDGHGIKVCFFPCYIYVIRITIQQHEQYQDHAPRVKTTFV
jgi:hypothetical protein